MAEYLPLTARKGDHAGRSGTITGGQLVIVPARAPSRRHRPNGQWVGWLAVDAVPATSTHLRCGGSGSPPLARHPGSWWSRRAPTVATHTTEPTIFNVVGLALKTATAGTSRDPDGPQRFPNKKTEGPDMPITYPPVSTTLSGDLETISRS